MDNVNKTLYIPLYGKAYVSSKNIIIRDKKAEEIWAKEGIVLEGVSMYFEPQELKVLLSNLVKHFHSIKLLMDCYTESAAKVSKYKNPISDVGVTTVYGYENPVELASESGLVFVKEYNMTPQKYIDELQGLEKTVFKNLFAGKIAKSMYRMYEFKKI